MNVERLIVRQVRINPRTSAIKMTLQCKIRFGKSLNSETIRNVLRKHRHHGRVPERKPYISKANRQARLAFAKMYVRQPTEYWENVIFVDESKYNIFGSYGKQKFGGNQIQQYMSKKIYGLLSNLEEVTKLSGDCMTRFDVENLHFIDGIMNKYVYILTFSSEI
ncbi:transposable element Tcb1 transposase [Trichonephila clavipes]|nr:transposable element Tcb1 transposase [Trichonephila clavipes]